MNQSSIEFRRAGCGLLQSDQLGFPTYAEGETQSICGHCYRRSDCRPEVMVRPDHRVQVMGDKAGTIYCSLVGNRAGEPRITGK